MMSSPITALLVSLVAPVAVAIGAVATGSVPVPAQDTELKGGEMLQCPDGSEVQSRFSRSGDTWEVTGILSTGLVGSITVAGPTGDVSAAAAINLVVDGDPQAGQPVTMTGTVAATGEMVATTITSACPRADAVPPPEFPAEEDVVAANEEAAEQPDEKVCNRGAGKSGDLLMHSNHGGVHIQRGQVTSLDGDTLVVQTPDGPMTVVIDDDTHLNGDPAVTFEVKVRGDLDDGVIDADEVKVLCPNPHGARGDDGDDDGEGEGDGEGFEGEPEKGDEDEGDS